jgi:hypothetical protein
LQKIYKEYFSINKFIFFDSFYYLINLIFLQMRTKNFFRNGLIAAVLLITLGYTACSDDLDYDGSSSYQQSDGLLRSSGATPEQLANTGDSVQQYAGLVISRIYFTGSGQNIYDQYIKISNNSSDTIDAQGVVVLESKFNSVTAFVNFNPPINVDTFVTGVIYRIPAPTPLAPGDSVVLAYQKANLEPDGFNIDSADYAWEGATGPFLDSIFSYSNTVWVPHNRGFTSYAIAALPEGVNDTTALIARGWRYDGTYELHSGGNIYYYTASKAYEVPVAWIIDAVHVWAPVYSSNVVQTIPTVLDAGYTWAGSTTNNNSPTRFRHGVTRIRDTTGTFRDTNDSSYDFIPNDYIINPF